MYLLFPNSSDALFGGCERENALLFTVKAGDIVARSNVGDGMVRSIDGESFGVLPDFGSGGVSTGRSESWDLPYLR